MPIYELVVANAVVARAFSLRQRRVVAVIDLESVVTLAHAEFTLKACLSSTNISRTEMDTSRVVSNYKLYAAFAQ